MAKKIYVVSDDSEKKWYYTSLQAICDDDSNPVGLTRPYLSRVKISEGFPIKRKGWSIEMDIAKGTSDI